MDTGTPGRKDMYYTGDHDWIDFNGSIAYIGVSAFKLTGFKAIHQCKFHQESGFARQGTLLVSIRYNEYEVELRMPVNGSILQLNNSQPGVQRLWVEQPETGGWLLKISPSQPYTRDVLILSNQYQMKGKSKFVRS